MKKLLLATVLFSSPLAAQTGDPAAPVSAERLRSDVEKLVSFGTRHTLSSQTDPKRGIGAAVDWGLAEFRRIGAACGNCFTVVAPERMVEGARIPTPTRLRNAVAIQRGTERPNEVVIVQGHIDSRVSDVMDSTSDAPGANDDASGTTLVLEAARVLSKKRYPVTIVYALLSGEEQGLHGGRLLADYAAEQGWQVKAVLNNDIVGNSCGSDSVCDANHVRVFSEGPRADLTDAVRAAQRRDGGENDSPSRNLSRWLDNLADGHKGGLNVRQVWRTDRMGRGGDQIPFQEKGYPAIRFSVAVEDYDHQHQDLRTENGTKFGDTIDEMDFPYLAKVTQLNIRALDALARTPAPPVPTAKAAVQTFTAVEWKPVSAATEYRIWQRRTDEPYWPAKPVEAIIVPASVLNAGTELVVHLKEGRRPGENGYVISNQSIAYNLEGVRGDDWIFGVSACTADGLCSPVASAVPAGGFEPMAAAKGDSD